MRLQEALTAKECLQEAEAAREAQRREQRMADASGVVEELRTELADVR